MDEYITDMLGPLFTIALAVLSVRLWRGVRGRVVTGPECRACGYSRVGLPHSVPCPECGTEQKYPGSVLHIRKRKTVRNSKRITIDSLLMLSVIAIAYGSIKLDDYRLGYYPEFIDAVRAGNLTKVEDYLNHYPELARGRFRYNTGLNNPGGPLVTAAYSQNKNAKEMVVLLLEHGADPNAPIYKEPFRFAMQHSDLELAEKLFEAGLNLSTDPQTSKTDMLGLAVGIYNCDLPFIELMLLNGADPNQHNGRPAITSANDHTNSTAVIKLLLDYDADPNRLDNNGLPPIYQCILRCDPPAAQALIDAEADLRFSHPDYGTPLRYAERVARQYPDPKRDQMVNLLIRNGADSKP